MKLRVYIFGIIKEYSVERNKKKRGNNIGRYFKIQNKLKVLLRYLLTFQR